MVLDRWPFIWEVITTVASKTFSKPLTIFYKCWCWHFLALTRLRLNSLLGKIPIPSSNGLEHEMVTGFSCPVMLRAMTTKTAHAQAMTNELAASTYLLENVINYKIHPISRDVSICEKCIREQEIHCKIGTILKSALPYLWSVPFNTENTW